MHKKQALKREFYPFLSFPAMVFAIYLFTGGDVHRENVGEIWGGVNIVVKVSGVSVVCFVEVNKYSVVPDVGGGEVDVTAIAEGFVA